MVSRYIANYDSRSRSRCKRAEGAAGRQGRSGQDWDLHTERAHAALKPSCSACWAVERAASAFHAMPAAMRCNEGGRCAARRGPQTRCSAQAGALTSLVRNRRVTVRATRFARRKSQGAVWWPWTNARKQQRWHLTEFQQSAACMRTLP